MTEERPAPEQPPTPSYLGGVPVRLAALGLTYRRLDYWTRVGYLRPDRPTPGSGYARGWSEEELRVAAAIFRLTESGLTVAQAAPLARRGPGAHVVTAGVVMYLTPALWDLPDVPPEQSGPQPVPSPRDDDADGAAALD